MCPFSKIFDLISYFFFSFINRIQRNRVCWFCLVWTDDSSIPYPHPRRTVGMCVVKMMKFSAVDFLSRRKILTMPKFAVNIYIFYVSRYFQCIFNFFYFGRGGGGVMAVSLHPNRLKINKLIWNFSFRQIIRMFTSLQVSILERWEFFCLFHFFSWDLLLRYDFVVGKFH